MNQVNYVFRLILFMGLLTTSISGFSQDWQSCQYLASKDYGIYTIKNNTWRNQDNSACMWANSKNNWGADMNYPDGSYPWGYWEIFRGAHYQDVSPDPELPIKIADIHELTVDWTQKQIPVSGNRVWSLIDLYAWKNADRSDHPKGHWNILVFTSIVDHTNSWGNAGEIQNRGTYQGKFNLGGVDWYVTHSPTPEFDHAGPTTSFYMADDYSHDVSVDLESLLDFATSQGWGSDQWYFGSLQAGWETTQGVQGGLETTYFSTTLNGSVDGNGAGSCSLTTSKSNHSFGSSAGSTTVDITTSESFTVSDNQSWITTSTNGNTVTINVTENTGSQRSGTVTITGCQTKTVSISQSAPTPPQGSNLLINGDFSNGTSDWDFFNNGASASFSVSNGEALVNISSSGSNTYQPQLVQDGFAIQNGQEYTLSFNARAVSNRTIQVYLSSGPSAYTQALNEDVSLTTSMQTFSYTFTSPITDSNARIDFNCGGNNANVTIDNVSLTTEAAPPPTTYTLTVNSGSGDGNYTAGTVVNISADAAPSGQQFAGWTGASVADANDPITTLTMPSANTSVTATYENIPSGGSGTITIRARLTSGTSDVLELRLDNTTVHSWTISNSYAEYSHSGITGSKDVKIYFKDQGTDAKLDYINVNGTVYQAENQSVNTSAWANGSCGGGNFTENMHCPGYIGFGTINFGGGTNPTYTLTVNNGNGDGSYAAGTVVNISANAAPSGQQFDAWTGDVANVADANSANTSITMPSNAATVTATYENIPSGGGSVTTIDDQDASITYSGGGWSSLPSGRTGQINNSEHETNGSGNFVEFTFSGTGIELIARIRPWGNTSANVSIDGISQGTVSFGGGDLSQQTIYSNQSLSNAQHTIRITNSNWDYIYVDAFRVTTGSGSRVTNLANESRDSINKELASNGNVMLYPNPVINGKLILKFDEKVKSKIQIYGLSGHLLMTESTGLNNLEIDVSSLKSGVYFLRLTRGDHVSLHKFIKGN